MKALVHKPGVWGICFMGGCQNYGPFLGTLKIGCRIIIGIEKGTIILTTTSMPNSLGPA